MWIDTYAPEGPDADKVTLNIYFHATPEGAAVERTDPNEVAEIRWFAPDELPADLAFPDHVPAVLRAWRDSLEPAARPSASTLASASAPAPARRPAPVPAREPEPTV